VNFTSSTEEMVRHDPGRGWRISLLRRARRARWAHNHPGGKGLFGYGMGFGGGSGGKGVPGDFSDAQTEGGEGGVVVVVVVVAEAGRRRPSRSSTSRTTM
jgi:hypothetical protein